MDWLEDFKDRFNDTVELKDLKKNQFYGYVQINFSKGTPTNVNCNVNIRAVCKYKETGNIEFNLN